jgi:hypothetical protein
MPGAWSATIGSAPFREIKRGHDPYLRASKQSLDYDRILDVGERDLAVSVLGAFGSWEGLLSKRNHMRHVTVY